jgi:hypothetical protein
MRLGEEEAEAMVVVELGITRDEGQATWPSHDVVVMVVAVGDHGVA